MKESDNKILKTIVVILSAILVLLIVIIITSGVAVMNYRSKVPTITMKHGVVIKEGDTIHLDDVAVISDNAIGYVMGASWEAYSSDLSSEERGKGIVFDGQEPHQITVSEGTGQLKVYVSAWGAVHEYTAGETIVTVEPRD